MWKLRLNNILKKGRLCIIHVGEGTDGEAVEEINELIRWNLLRRNLVAVHGVAMTPEQASHFRALIWCPASNLFLFDRTAIVDKLQHKTCICFGSDSTLTSGWNIWEHLRLARKTRLVSDEKLYAMLSVTPSTVWNISSGLAVGEKADLVVAETEGPDWNSFFSIDPEKILLVLHQGVTRIFDESIKDQLSIDVSQYDMINIKGRTKYVGGGLKKLIHDIRLYAPETAFPINIIEN